MRECSPAVIKSITHRTVFRRLPPARHRQSCERQQSAWWVVGWIDGVLSYHSVVPGFYSEHLKSIPNPLSIADHRGHPLLLSVEKNSRLPVTGATVVYTLSIAAPSPMSSVPLVSSVNIYQGSENDTDTAKRFVASYTYAAVGPPNGSTGRGVNEVQITLHVDAHGGVNTLVHDLRWGNKSTRKLRSQVSKRE